MAAEVEQGLVEAQELAVALVQGLAPVQEAVRAMGAVKVLAMAQVLAVELIHRQYLLVFCRTVNLLIQAVHEKPVLRGLQSYVC